MEYILDIINFVISAFVVALILYCIFGDAVLKVAPFVALWVPLLGAVVVLCVRAFRK